MNLGKNIKQLRKRRGLTLLEVAKQTQIDIATLSRIENGKMTGTVHSHLAIAKVLGVHLPDLYEKAFATDEKDTAKESAGYFSHTGGSVSELLTTLVLHKKMMPVRLAMKPGSGTQEEEMPLGTERFVYVLKGKIEVTVKKETHEIASGQSFYFNASVPHSFRNLLKTGSTCLVITSPPNL